MQIILQQLFKNATPSLLVSAFGDIARAKGGMAEIARISGLNRELLYRALRSESKPRFETIYHVCSALGIRVIAEPKQA